MQRDVGQAQRLRTADELAEHPAAARKVADLRATGVVDPHREKALERLATLVEDAQRRVARVGELARDIEDPREQRLAIELGHQPAPDIDQAKQPMALQLLHIAPSSGVSTFAAKP